jgi:hypothetical protein
MQCFKKFLRWTASLPNRFALACRWQSAKAIALALFDLAEAYDGAAPAGTVTPNITVVSAAIIRRFRIGSPVMTLCGRL